MNDKNFHRLGLGLLVLTWLWSAILVAGIVGYLTHGQYGWVAYWAALLAWNVRVTRRAHRSVRDFKAHMVAREARRAELDARLKELGSELS